jgi:hypothetical protein
MTEKLSLKAIDKVLWLLFGTSPETSCLILDMKHVDRLLQNTVCFSTIIQTLHRNKPRVFSCLSKQNSVAAYDLCTLVEDPCESHYCPPGFECYLYQSSDCPGCEREPDCREFRNNWKGSTCVAVSKERHIKLQAAPRQLHAHGVTVLEFISYILTAWLSV